MRDIDLTDMRRALTDQGLHDQSTQRTWEGEMVELVRSEFGGRRRATVDSPATKTRLIRLLDSPSSNRYGEACDMRIVHTPCTPSMPQVMSGNWSRLKARGGAPVSSSSPRARAGTCTEPSPTRRATLEEEDQDESRTDLHPARPFDAVRGGSDGAARYGELGSDGGSSEVMMHSRWIPNPSQQRLLLSVVLVRREDEP